MSSVFELAKQTLARALGPQGPNVSFTITQEPQPKQDYDSIWTLFKGTKKDDSTPVSVFICDLTRHQDKKELARNALKKAKTIRHPNILKFIDGIETETQIIIGTESVEPLSTNIRENQNPDLICWGLYKIATAMKFLNMDCQLLHGNLRIGSIYSTQSGEWKLSGFEFLGSIKDDPSLFTLYATRQRNTSKYFSPEVFKGNSRNTPFAIDAFGFACLVHELYNGVFTRIEEVGQRGNIPINLYELFRSMMHPDPQKRMDFSVFLQLGMKQGGYFDSDMIWTSTFLEEINMKETVEKELFLRKMDEKLESFPIQFSKYKVLPELLKAIEFGGAGAKALPQTLKIGLKLDKNEFNSLILPTLVNLFASQDRAIRLSLCENLQHFIPFIPDKIINEKIFPSLSSGFNDTVASIREQTLKAILPMAPKLSERNLNNDLLRFLSKLQTDEQPGIRTNTVVCLGKISKHLNSSTQKRVLCPAFLRALADPFPPARNAGLLAFAATIEYYDIPDISGRIIPIFSRLLIDPERSIRNQAFKNMNQFIEKLKSYSDAMPDPKPPPNALGSNTQLSNGSNASPFNTNNAVNTSSNVNWTDWALNTMSTKLAGMSVDQGSSNISTTTTTTTTTFTSSNTNKSNPSTPSSVLNNVNQTYNTSFKSSNHAPSTNNKSHTMTSASTSNDGWNQDGWNNDLIDFDDFPPAQPSIQPIQPIPMSNLLKSNNNTTDAVKMNKKGLVLSSNKNKVPQMDVTNEWSEDWGAWSSNNK